MVLVTKRRSNGKGGSPDPTNDGRMKQSSRRCDVLLIYLLLAAVLVTLFSIFGPTLYIVQAQAQVQTNGIHDPPRKIIEVDELDHEEDFLRTIKSCLPTENFKDCAEFIPEPIASNDNNSNNNNISNNMNKKVQRVAVITPPGDISDALWKHVTDLAHRHNQHRADNKNNNSNNDSSLDIEVILTSHVPPYGYGKSHGLTKIVRLVPQPLLLEVTDALTNLLETGESYQIITLDDLKAALRMILRMHCRLSHVAAHTALQSVSALELLQNPQATMELLRKFVTPHDHVANHGADNGDDKANGGGDDDLRVSNVDDDQVEMLEGEAAYGTQILTHVQAASRQNVLAVLDRVLVQEIEDTHHFSKWPCPSFWAAGKDSINSSNSTDQALSPLLERLARALSPDCDDPYNSCFVQRDQCEYHGQADCPGSKKQRKRLVGSDEKVFNQHESAHAVA